MSFLAKLRRRLRPPRTLSVTSAGRTFLVLTIGVGLGALNTGNNLLYLVLAMQLSVVIVSGILSERTLRDLTVRRIGTEAAYAGEPCTYRWALRPGKSGAFAVTVAEADVPLAGEGTVAFAAPGEETVVRAQVFAFERGPMALSGVKVTTHYPLGLFAKSRIVPLEGTLLVYPRRRPVGAVQLPEQDGRGEGERSRPHALGTGDPAGVRPLRDGEDARGIHWVKSAGSPVLLKLERDRELRRTFELTLTTTGPGRALDSACEELAASALQLLAQGHSVGLTTPGKKLRPAAGAAQASRVLQALAWAGFEEPA
jgi:uncharacterized protein (DUF58 family)